MQTLPQGLAALASYRQFVIYKLTPRKGRPGKMDKRPVDHRTRQVMRAGIDWQNDPASQTDAQSAINLAAELGRGYGVGFLFAPTDPFFFLDLDECKNPDGSWTPIAIELCQRFAGAAVEISQSGTGLHIFGTLSGPAPAHGCVNKRYGLELYTQKRIAALTGTGFVGDIAADMSAAFSPVVAEYFPPAAAAARPKEWTDGPAPGYSGPADDVTLIAKMLASGGTAGQVFGGKASFAALWNADPAALGRAYPDNYGNRAYDESSADAALAAHLAFWTGCDCERVDRLMRQSALVRDKWDTHRTYLREFTITNAVSRCDQIYTGGVMQRVDQPKPESNAQPGTVLDAAAPDGPQLVDGFQYLAATQQMDHFAGCVYVQEVHRVFTPRGVLLKPEQFKATYGGYVFSLDATNDKTTKSAWEAFTESQAVRYPIAESMTFRPELTPGALLEEEGRPVVNTYTPAKVRKLKGDPSRFLDQLARVLPDKSDQAILLAYMAACVQHVGIKFQWWPLLQGVEGNGKTLFTRCVAHAVGMGYSHFPKAEEVGSKFNSWMARRLFIGIEDVYYPGHKQDIWESLKPIITNETLPIEYKGVDQMSVRVCANGMMNSNHRDAIRKTKNDRRAAVFFSAQQSAADLIRDGMGGDYFPDLYVWLRADGYAIVTEYLSTYPIPDALNPATKCQRAPRTSTTDQAIEHGAGTVEQEIIEAVEEGRQGFAGGWVSSKALDKLLEDLRLTRAIPPNRRRGVMQDLGYDWHPALNNGRVNNPIGRDGGKPRLYIKAGHPDAELQSPALVAQAYTNAQSGAAVRLVDTVFGATIDGPDRG